MKISVITATFNSEKTIEDCLDSFKDQNYLFKELIVIDGKSTDRTLEILQRRNKDIAEMISESDRGIYEALNKGIKLASGDVVGFLHSDDEYASAEVLNDVAEAFNNEKVCAVYGNLLYVSQSDTDKIIRKWESQEYSPDLLRRGWMPAHPTLYVRKKYYEEIGGFSLLYPICADYDSIIKLFNLRDFHAAFIPKVFVKMRVGGKSKNSLLGIIAKIYQDYSILRNYGFNKLKSSEIVIRKRLIKLGQIF